MVLLETARLRLRQFTPDHVERLVDLDELGYRLRRASWGRGLAITRSRWQAARA